MLFSPAARDAIRALTYLAARQGDGPILGREIAEAESIPKPFLSKLLHDLRTKGMVKTTKGPGGGYELARPADKLRVIEVVDAIDGPLDLERMCILGLGQCSSERACTLHEPWKRFREMLARTIAELTLREAAAMLAHKRGGSGNPKAG